MKKILIWSIVAILVLGIAAGACWWFLRPQTLTLSDGTQITLVAVDYGKSHSLPFKKYKGRNVHGSTMQTPEDSLCVWVYQKHKANQWPNYQSLIYDSANTACAGTYMTTYANFDGNNQTEQIVGIVFEAFPRRSRTLYFRVQQYNQRNGGRNVDSGKISIHNPAPRGAFPRWSPETLPIAKSDDDLQVTLTTFGIVDEMFNNGGGRGKDKTSALMNKAVFTSFRTEQGGTVVTNWQPVQITTTDATGNQAQNRSWSNRHENDEEVMVYQWGLWPDEPAWKLRVEMSRSSGYTDSEIWTATNIVITNGNMNDMWNSNPKQKAVAETTMGESHLKIFPVIKVSKQDSQNYGGRMQAVVHIKADPMPEGMRMGIKKITDDQDRPLKFNNWGSGGGDYRFSIEKLGDTKFVNVTLAYHRSRFVEFTVKPVKK